MDGDGVRIARFEVLVPHAEIVGVCSRRLGTDTRSAKSFGGFAGLAPRVHSGGSKLVGETGFETDPLVIVLGSEGKGLSRLTREACDCIASIPMTNAVESLNASVAAGIAMYAADRARREAAE